MSAYQNKGMATWMDQEKDRQKWKEAVAKRKQLLKEIAKYEITVINGRWRSMKEL